MNKIIDNLSFHPTLLTYGMIGMTTIILAALTVFDSSDSNQPGEEEPSYVSQLFSTQSKDEQNEETGLVSSLFPNTDIESSVVSGGKTRKRHSKANRKTRYSK